MTNRVALSIAILLACCQCAHAQDDNTYTFTVRTPNSEVIIHQDDSVLYTDHKNRFGFTVTGKNTLGPVLVEGGKVTTVRNSCTVTVNEGTEAVMVVYLRKPNGKLELGTSRTYPIVHLPPPVPEMGGVKPDSVIYREDLLRNDFMCARITRFGETKWLKVAYFEMQIVNDDGVDTLRSAGDRFSIEMRRYVQTLKPGVPLSFVNIHCYHSDGSIRRLKDMMLFVNTNAKSGVLTGREKQ